MALTDSQFDTNRNNTFNPYNIRGSKVQGDLETNVIGASLPGIFAGVNSASALEPQRQAGLKQLIDMFSPQNMGNLINQYGQRQQGMATDNARQMQGLLSSRGGIGAAQGAAIQAGNNANQNTSQYSSSLMGPEGQQQIAQLLQQLYSQAQSNPMLQQILPFLQEMSQARQFQQANQNQQGSIFGGLLGAAGSLAGGGAFNGLFGGGHATVPNHA